MSSFAVEALPASPATPPAQPPVLPPVPPEELERSVQACDTAAINAFGERAQAEVARYADSILRQVKGREAGDAGQLITELMLKAKGLDAADLRSAGLVSKLLGGVQRQAARFRARFETVADQIDEISAQLGLRVDRMRQDLDALDGLYAHTRAAVLQLDGFIAAGQACVAHARAEPASPPPPPSASAEALLAAQDLQDRAQGVERLDKRIFMLQQTRQIAVQQLPQIRLVQNGDAAVLESLSAALTLTVPAWKQKMVLILGLQRQQEALALQKAVSDTTNALIQATSQMLQTQAVEVERQAGAGVVDLDLLARTNQDLISTLESVARLQAETSAKRRQAAQGLEQQSSQLITALSGEGERSAVVSRAQAAA